MVGEMVRRRLEETEGSTAYPRPPDHRVVTVGVAWLDPLRRDLVGTVLPVLSLAEHKHTKEREGR